jgi:hypothetical protein
MATGRTKDKWKRIYIDGYDLSGYTRTVGPLETTFDEADLTVWTDSTKGYQSDWAQANIGALNGVFDNTATSGIHAVLGTSGVERVVTVAQGIRAAPAQGDPCFCGQFLQSGYQAQDDGGAAVVTIPFAGWAGDASTRLYPMGWGYLLHANAAATGANTASGVDWPTAAATAKGGYFIYHVTAGDDGTVTLSVDDSADNSNWLALSGATSGSINATAGTSAIVALGATATVRRYLRWQVALDTAVTVTFVAAFVRGY